MRDYFIRRFLLIPPTLLGISLIVFIITRAAPGGPFERAMAEMQQAGAGGGGRAPGGQSMALSDAQIAQMRAYYGFDKPLIPAYLGWLGKVARGDLGASFRYNEPVTAIMAARLPVSIFYGLVTLVITYAVCVPLGIVKAVRHRTLVDNSTSLLIFTGYAVPGYALGAVLLLVFGARLEWFPMRGFTGFDFEDMTPWGKILDLGHHAVLPLVCYLIGSFAVTTMLMKNHLMDNLSADYVRTAVAKGVSFRRAVLGHALRNSIIPIATTFGQNITLLVTGSFLIESIFDIDGFGLLGISSITNRDYFVSMGIVMVSALLLMLGNIISDMLVALIDPRIRFK
ncbi:MAG: ABC transporter permease [Opitutaceae bacterium]|jgi:microcin C transport system permease protein|nr:ABC transporter permease [Opitutaceae bacterium]